MSQSITFTSIYTADTMGVCSALFELGGMCVMDDASGCNSTYNTHDEPRWYDTDSLVFITALTENEALMGEDGKTVSDIVSAAERLRPRFIALAGTPIPAMCGTDIPALGRVIEKRSGIPAFGIQTDGMHSYLSGCSKAFAALAERAVAETGKRRPRSVNILGLTPLDFSVGGMAESAAEAVKAAGFEVVSSWAMGSSFDDIARSGEAAADLVVSETGLAAARALERRFGIPYVVGAPFGRFAGKVFGALEKGETADLTAGHGSGDTVIIGERVTSASLAAAIEAESGISVRVLCPLESELSGGGDRIMEESEIARALEGAKTVVADPLYRPLLPEGARLVELPHEAFSGRIFRSRIPDLVKNTSIIINEVLS
ncbi:MAG: nitrogenase component 1 [Clostridiales bacterium]|nr:nitrogenase component 1 [Clostridiales bacterium]